MTASAEKPSPKKKAGEMKTKVCTDILSLIPASRVVPIIRVEPVNPCVMTGTGCLYVTVLDSDNPR